MEITVPNREDCIGKWVNLRSSFIEERVAVLAEMDVDLEQTIRQIENDDSVLEYSYEFDPATHGPMDLLWYGSKRFIVPRTTWSPKARL